MENHEKPYRTILPVDDISRVMYEYNKKSENSNLEYLDNKANGLNDLVKEDEKITADEIHSVEHQIAEREKIKQSNIRFLEEQRQKLEGFMNTTECFTYNASGIINAVRSKLTTQLVQVDLKKGEEYVNTFRDIQRLEEQKRKLLAEETADQGWLQ